MRIIRTLQYQFYTVPIQQTAIESFSSFELLAKQVVEGFITGLHKSPFHGFSVEFAEHRLYNKGGSTRHIDWKLYGRTDKLFVKRFEEETNLRCQLVIDNSSSMYYPESNNTDTKQLNKIGFSAYAAAAIMLVLKNQADAFGLSLFSEKLELQTVAKSSRVHQKYIMSELEKLVSDKQTLKKSATVEALHTIAESTHKRSLVILFSDLLDSNHQTEELFQALQHLKHNKHEVVVFHVVDKKTETSFEWENRPYHFVDLETNEEIKLNPTQYKQQYTDQLNAYYTDFKNRCGAYKIDFVEADIAEGFGNVLLRYLIKRQGI